MSDPEAGPPEREVVTFKFQQLCRLKVFEDKPETLAPKERSQLLATSNKYGYTFVGTTRGVAVIPTSVITQLHEDTDTTSGIVTVESFGCERVPLAHKPLHIALNADELILSVCYASHTGLKLDLYDVRVLTRKSTTTAPFASTTLSKETDCFMVDLKWNPGVPLMFATCLSDGSLAFWDCTGDLKMTASLPKENGCRAICWSPKGKQIVVGTAAGTLVQYNHGMQQKKHIAAPDFIDEPVKVVDISWLSTYIFAAAYIDAEDALQPNLIIVSAPKDQPTSFMNFEDVCFGSGEERYPHYFMQLLDKWDLMIACSSNAMEAVVLGKQETDKSKWEIWTLDDAARVEMPLCDNEDTFPLGVALSYNSHVVIKMGEKQLPPVPLLLVLSTEGLLCPFYCVNIDATQGITTKPQPLPVGGERIGGSASFQVQPVIPQAKPVVPVAVPAPAPAAVQPIAPSSTVPQKQFSFAPQPAPTTTATSTFGTSPQPAPTTTATSTFGTSGFSFATPSSSAFTQPTAPSSGFSFTIPKTTATAAFGTPSTAATTTQSTGLFGKPISSTPIASTSGPASFSFTKPAIASSGAGSSGTFSFVSPKPVTPTATTLAAPSQPAKPQAQAFSFQAGATSSGSTAKSAFSFTQQSAATAGFGTPQPPQAAISLPQSTTASAFSFSLPKTTTTVTTTSVGNQPVQYAAMFNRGLAAPDAPDAKAVPSSVQTKPTTTPTAPLGASSLSSLLGPSGPPNSVPPVRAIAPPNAVAPSGGSMVGAPINQFPQNQPTAAASKPPSMTASMRPPGIPPNQVAPSGGSPLKTNTVVGIAKPAAVPVAKPTPAAVKTAVKHPFPRSEGTQAATPKADHAAIETALFSNIKEVMDHFRRDMAELKGQVDGMINSDDNIEEDELGDIRFNVDQLASYRKELVDWSKSLNEEVHDIRTKLFSTFSQLEEAKVRRQRNNDPRYVQLLRTRGLDPQTARKMKEIRSMYHYIETGVRDVNSCLDAEWEDLQQKRNSRRGRKMGTPTMEAIYQTLSNNYNVIISQRGQLEAQRSRLKQARRYDISSAPWQQGALPSPAPGKDDTDLASLADTMAKARIRSPQKSRLSISATPVSAKKQSKLRDVLSRRTHTPRRAAPMESRSDVGSEASSYTYDKDALTVQPSRRLFLTEEDEGLDEDDLYTADNVGSEELFAEDEHDAAIFAGRQGMGDFRKSAVMMGVAKSGGALGALLDKPSGVGDDRIKPVQPTMGFGRPVAVVSCAPVSVPLPASRPINMSAGPLPITKPTTTGPPTFTSGPPSLGPPSSTMPSTTSFAPAKTAPSSVAPSSGFSHTGLGTVAWGATDPSKLSPSQAAGVAALNRIGMQKPPASTAPPVKPPPPVVNVKNLDTMRESMPPPVTFAPVASSVDAGTAKVVTQVIAEMAAASGVTVPPPGSPAAGATAVSTMSLQAPVTTPTAGFSFTQKLPSSMIKSASTSALPSMAGAKTSFSFGASSSGSTGFSFGAAGTVFGGTGTSGVVFGGKVPEATVASAPSANLATNQSLNQGKAVLQASDDSTAAPSSRASGTTSPGVKPNLFDFKNSTSMAASTSTPGGFFMAGQSTLSKPVQPSDDTPPNTSSPTRTTTAVVTPVTPQAVSPPANIVDPPQPTASSTPVATKPSNETKPAVFGQATLSSLFQTQSAKVVGDDTKPPPPGVDEAGTTGTPSNLFGQPAKPAGGLFGTVVGKPVGISQPAGVDEAGTGLPSPPVIAEATDSVKLTPSVSSGTPPTTSAASSASGFSFVSKPNATGTSLAGLLGAPTASSDATTSSSQTQPTSAGTAVPASSAATGFSFSSPGVAKSLFGQTPAAATTTASTTTTSSASSFTFASKPVFGSTVPASTSSSAFGSSSGTVFGSAASTSSSGFGSQPASTASSGPFGTATTTTSAFGSGSGFGGQTTQPVFGSSSGPFGGSSTTATSSSSGGGDVFGGGGGFFSGLGGQPNPEAAKTNPFGVASGTTSSAGLFGTQGAKTFGSGTSTGGFGGGGFSGNSSGVGSTGFGGFAQQTPASSSSGFGSPAAFGTSSAFGSPPSFGSGATFGSAGFSSPFGGGGGGSGGGGGMGSKTFGSPGGTDTAGTGGGGFGGFASQDTPSFGNLASPSSAGGFGAAANQSGGGFGSNQSGGGFGSNQSGGGFGSPAGQSGGGFGQQGGGGFGGGGGGFGSGGGGGGFGAFGGNSSSSSGFGTTGNTGGSASFGGGSSFSQYRS